ncbi:MAG TPA: DUF5666 domain-containing protein [Candidatus Paceibacterota bacterium]|nr:DUF5666 domain-containing protein [Candidatus Paceibacterota bacterium]
MITLKHIAGSALGAALALGLAGTALAAPSNGATAPLRGAKVHGSVSAINGSTLTLTKNDGTTYTVDTSNATSFYSVTRAGTSGTRSRSASSLSAVALGDTVTAKGELQNGNVLTAKKVFDISGARPLHGTVAAVSGSTITLAAKNGTTYTVDTSNATQFWQVVAKAGLFGKRDKVPSSLGDIAVGDVISVHGSLSTDNTAVVSASTVVEHLGKSNS